MRTSVYSLLGLFLLCSQQFIFALPSPLQFATEATYPPFESVNNKGEIVGFDIDVAKTVCKRMKVECTFSNQPWDGLIPGLALGKFDAVISAFAITDARKQRIDFSTPYYASTGSFVALGNLKVSIDPTGLKGRTIGVQGGTTFQQYIEARYPGTEIKTYSSMQDAFLDLTSSRIDLVFGDTPVVALWLKSADNANHKYKAIGGPISDPAYFATGYGIGVKKGNHELLDAIDKALSSMRADGTLQQLIRTYFSTGDR